MIFFLIFLFATTNIVENKNLKKVNKELYSKLWEVQDSVRKYRIKKRDLPAGYLHMLKEIIPQIKILAKKGDDYAQFSLGEIYFTGLGLPRNYKNAMNLFRKSAKQGNIYAMINLGRMFLDGKGCKKNQQKAFVWFSKAFSSNTGLQKLYIVGSKRIKEYDFDAHITLNDFYHNVCTGMGGLTSYWACEKKSKTNIKLMKLGFCLGKYTLENTKSEYMMILRNKWIPCRYKKLIS